MNKTVGEKRAEGCLHGPDPPGNLHLNLLEIQRTYKCSFKQSVTHTHTYLKSDAHGPTKFDVYTLEPKIEVCHFVLPSFVRGKLEAIRLLLSMSPDDVAVVGESGEPVADISLENMVSSSLMKRSKLSGSGSSGSSPKRKALMPQSPAAGGSWIEGLETFNKVGQGSFGQVFRGKWQGKDVAVKVMTWKQGKKSKVDPIREAEICRKLRHPNLVQAHTFSVREITEAGAPEHEIWIIQEWCNGGTLSRFAASNPYTKPEGEELIGRILRDVGSGLKYLHDMDVVHGDLSSSNVMLTYPGTAVSCHVGPFQITFLELGVVCVFSEVPIEQNMHQSMPTRTAPSQLHRLLPTAVSYARFVILDWLACWKKALQHS